MPTRRTSSLLNCRRWLGLAVLAALALAAQVAVLSPHQGPVAMYKLGLMLAGGVAGYALDRALWPFASPSSYLVDDWRDNPDADEPGNADYPVVVEYKSIFCIAMLRQAAMAACGMLAVSLGL